jgi:hypothetical protein
MKALERPLQRCTAAGALGTRSQHRRCTSTPPRGSGLHKVCARTYPQHELFHEPACRTSCTAASRNKNRSKSLRAARVAPDPKGFFFGLGRLPVGSSFGHDDATKPNPMIDATEVGFQGRRRRSGRVEGCAVGFLGLLLAGAGAAGLWWSCHSLVPGRLALLTSNLPLVIRTQTSVPDNAVGNLSAPSPYALALVHLHADATSQSPRMLSGHSGAAGKVAKVYLPHLGLVPDSPRAGDASRSLDF